MKFSITLPFKTYRNIITMLENNQEIKHGLLNEIVESKIKDEIVDCVLSRYGDE